MNKDAIKKALEYCAGDSIDDCKNCPYANNGPFACSISMYKDALNLITEQEEEINALQEENRRLDEYVSCTLSAQEFDEEIKQAKIDVLNELKEKCKFDGHTVAVYKNDIDEMITEMQNAEDKG